MKNGDAAKSGVEFGGSHFQPVGDPGKDDDSTVGDSASTVVDGMLYELTAKYKFGSPGHSGYIAVSVGRADQEDKDSAFDRDWRWFTIEPLYYITPRFYAVVRFSEIGTYDDNEGYHFDGKTLAGGNSAFGYDVQRFNRLGIGLGYQPNPRTRIKLEIGKDHYELIDVSLKEPNNDERDFVGAEIAVKF